MVQKRIKLKTYSNLNTLKIFSACRKRIPLVARGCFIYCSIIKVLKWNKSLNSVNISVTSSHTQKKTKGLLV